jgi:HD superfamily phosphohydrolase
MDSKLPAHSGRKVKPVVHRDQIHGDVKLDPLSVALLSTEALQRLGRIYQLGYAHLVYRGGTHTRLSHVMGAAHTAGVLIDSLRHNYTQKQEYWPTGAVPPAEFLPLPDLELQARWDFLRHVCVWAALLHDAGHIPLGHTLEDEFEALYPKHDDLKSARIAYLWCDDASGEPSEIRAVLENPTYYPESFRSKVTPGEVFGAVLLTCLHKEEPANDKEPKKPFAKVVGALSDTDIVHRLLRKAFFDTQKRAAFSPYFADVVGDTICADYLDYLRRDPTNVGLDVLRDDRIISRFYVGREEAAEPNLYRMALSLVDRAGHSRLDTCTGVIDLVRQRFRFAEIIYYHKTKVAASAMFAKAIKLIGKPEEIGKRKELIKIWDIPNLGRSLIDDPSRVSDLQNRVLPRNLLDPEIGDESLHLMLAYRGWESIHDGAAQQNRRKVENSLRGISLLQAISRRRLYKVCFVLDHATFLKLMPGITAHVIEDRIGRVLKTLRNEGKGDGNDERTLLETDLIGAASWPEDALILYVPGRKSQAKGIGTYALQGNSVVTLEKHPAVQNKVEELNRDYRNLWRIILLINPDERYLGDAVGLSKAVDVLVQRVVAIAENVPDSVDFRTEWSGALIASCWLKYIPGGHRLAAQLYRCLLRDVPPDWVQFMAVPQLCAAHDYSCDSYAHAALAYMSFDHEAFPMDHAIDQLVHGDLGAQLETILRSQGVLTAGANWIECAKELDVMRNTLTDSASAEGAENLIRTGTQLSSEPTPPLAPSANDASIRLAARNVRQDKEEIPDLLTVAQQRPSAEEVFARLSGIPPGSKIWIGRINAIKEFLAVDNLGALDTNVDFIEALEKQFAKKRGHIYTMDELRAAYARFRSRA